MWPMLNGLDPLLGKGPFGAFRTPAGQLVHWVRTNSGVAPSPEMADAAPAFMVAGADAPLAVLLGPRTSSSGEMTAMAFAGRESSRSFGATIAGFTTANVTVPMSDGAVLAITTSYVRDRTGHEYTGAMVPDEPVDVEEVEAAAMRWLQGQGSC
jgi:carboxyl-terminal processing protease